MVVCGPLLYFYESQLFFYEVLLKFNGFKFTRELFRYMKDTLVRILCNKSVTLLSKCLYLPNGGNLKTSKTGHSRNPLPYSDSQSQHDPSTVARPYLGMSLQKKVEDQFRPLGGAYLERVCGEYENEAVELHLPVLRSQLSICSKSGSIRSSWYKNRILGAGRASKLWH